MISEAEGFDMGEFTWSHLLTIIGLSWGIMVFVGGLIAGWANWRLNAKVDREEYVEKHAAVVSQGFCSSQHDKTNSAIEALSEEFAGLAIQVRELLVNQKWIVKTLSQTYEHNHRHANPDMPPLDPLPPGIADEEEDGE